MINDFTKEELENLLKWYNNSDTREYTNKTKPLFEKIQSMIDSYCEHDDSSPNHDYKVEKCKKSGGFYR